MTDKSPKTEDEPGAQERFDRGVKNALAMPPKPHAKKHALDKPAPVSSPRTGAKPGG